MLIGRTIETKFLQNYYEKNGCQIIVVYGAKGIGKISLLKEFTVDKSAFFYSCRDCEDQEQRYQFGQELIAKNTELTKFPTWSELLKTASDNKEILILNDFSNILKTDNSFLEEFQNFHQSYSSDQKLLVILVCSSICWVENSMVKKMKKTALLLSGMIKMKPLDFYQIQKIFPAYPMQNQLMLYGILGGNPQRWKLCDPDKSVQENIIDIFIREDAVLQFEAQMILKNELRELNVYQTILSTLAMGDHKLNDIYQQTGFSRAKISVYLKNLIQLEIVEKVFSVNTADQINTQKGLYQISDPIIAFYYTFIFQNQSSYRFLSAKEFYQMHVEPYLGQFGARAFRTVCMEYLLHRNRMHELPIYAIQSGEWIGKKASIDIILQDEKDHYLIGFCNWEKEELAFSDYEWLLYSAKQAKIEAKYIWLFSAGSFDKKLKLEAERVEHLKLISLSELNLNE